MTDKRNMGLQDSLALLNKLGLIEWLSRDTKGSTRFLINSIARDLLSGINPFDCRPAIRVGIIYDFFYQNRWTIDWFDLLSGEFVNAVELNANSIALDINDHEPMMGIENAEEMIVSFAKQWESNAKNALDLAMQD